MLPQFWFILGFMIYWLTLYIDVQTDYKRILRKLGVEHNRGALLRCIGLLPAAYLMGWRGFPAGTWQHGLVIAIVMLIFISLVYWTLFDGLLNNKRRINFWKPGGLAIGMAVLDKFLNKLSRTQIKVVKIGSAAVSFAALVIIINIVR